MCSSCLLKWRGNLLSFSLFSLFPCSLKNFSRLHLSWKLVLAVIINCSFSAFNCNYCAVVVYSWSVGKYHIYSLKIAAFMQSASILKTVRFYWLINSVCWLLYIVYIYENIQYICKWFTKACCINTISCSLRTFALFKQPSIESNISEALNILANASPSILVYGEFQCLIERY